MTRQNLFLALGALALLVLPLAFAGQGAGFGGSDDQATGLIGTLQPAYHRWVVPLWTPPSPEIESLLFALQSAFGAGAVAYCLGYWRGRRQGRQTARHGDAARD